MDQIREFLASSNFRKLISVDDMFLKRMAVGYPFGSFARLLVFHRR